MSPTAAYRLIQLFEILRCQYRTVKCNGSFDCGTTVNLALIKLSRMHCIDSSPGTNRNICLWLRISFTPSARLTGALTFETSLSLSRIDLMLFNLSPDNPSISSKCSYDPFASPWLQLRLLRTVNKSLTSESSILRAQNASLSKIRWHTSYHCSVQSVHAALFVESLTDDPANRTRIPYRYRLLVMT
eukprot:scaffold17516_cov22-Cyclotella_meneghiniana.AAC.2